jgi:heme/copper-type cytochrome/quinol oxidase subunit 3
MSQGARAPAKRRSLPNGVWGIALFIATEATLFGSLIATYFYLRFKHEGWPLGGIDPPAAALPLAITAALAATALPMLLASRAAQRGRVGMTAAWTGAALAVQVGYLVVQIHLFADDLSKFKPTTNAYGSVYFTLLGADHFHVLIGLLLSLWLLSRLATGLTDYRVIATRVIAWYWCFASAVAVAVTLTLLSSSL